MRLFHIRKRPSLEEIVKNIELTLIDNYFDGEDALGRYRTEISVSFDVGEDGKVMNFKHSMDGKDMTIEMIGDIFQKMIEKEMGRKIDKRNAWKFRKLFLFWV